MRSTSIHVAWLLAAAGSALVIGNDLPQAPLVQEPLNITLLGEPKYDQIRFLQCVKGDPLEFGRIIAYYEHPPQGSEKPTQVAFKKFDSIPWGHGFSESGTATDGAGWSSNIDEYEWAPEKFRGWVGTIKYGYTGFNCFIDEGQGAHFEGGDYGSCYSELYCTYQHAMNVQVDSSKDTVKLVRSARSVDGERPPLPSESSRELVKLALENVKKGIKGQQCVPDPIDVSPDCTMTVECVGGDSEYLETLADTLLAVFDTDEDLYKGIDTKECSSRPPQCNPATGRCRELSDICDYTKGVQVPARYRLSVADKAPPNSGENSVPLGDMQVDIHCQSYKDDAMCNAMSKLLWGLGLYGPISGLFKAASLGVKSSCL